MLFCDKNGCRDTPLTSNKFALVVGNNRYEIPGIAPLATAEADAERVCEFLKSTSEGGVDPTRLVYLKSPDYTSVKIQLDRLASESSKSDGSILILYFACHGIMNDKEGIRLLFRDSDPERLLLTSLSIRSIATTLSEYQCKASITILDVCQSGGHQQGITEFSFGEILRKEGLIPDGHFILSASASDQTAKEGVLGGKFTTLLLDVVDEVGKRFTTLPELPIDIICASIIDAAKTRLTNQTPIWSGVSISKGISFCTNPHWDSQAKPAYTDVTFKEISAEDREHFRPILFEINGLIGDVSKGEFKSLIGQMEALVASTASNESKSILLKRIADTLLTKNKSTDNPEPMVEVFQASIAFQSQVLGPTSYLNRELSFHVSEFSPEILRTLPNWISEKGWLGKHFGPSSIGLAPIIFWSKIGTLAFVALCCKINAKKDSHDELIGQISGLLKSKPELMRITWGGQYADVALVISMISTVDAVFAKNVIDTLLANYIKVKPSGLPAPVYLESEGLGEYLGMYFAGSSPQERFEDWGDEFLSLSISLNLLLKRSPLEINSLLGELQNKDENIGDIFLYNVSSLNAYFMRIGLSQAKCPLGFG